MRILRSVSVAFVMASGLLLAGCQPQVSVPTETGVCWHMVTLEDGSELVVVQFPEAALHNVVPPDVLAKAPYQLRSHSPS